MNTCCKIYKLKPERIADYRKAHGSGFPLWQAKVMRDCGAEDMEEFIWGEYVIITYSLRVSWGEFIASVSQSVENAKWQEIVSPMFDEMPVFDGEFAPLEKIFSLSSFA